MHAGVGTACANDFAFLVLRNSAEDLVNIALHRRPLIALVRFALYLPSTIVRALVGDDDAIVKHSSSLPKGRGKSARALGASDILPSVSEEAEVYDGRCSCGSIHFQMKRAPIFVHCCHCSYCQRETGTSFALNALVESSEITLVQGEPETIELETKSGKGKSVSRCPKCRVALWSQYGAAGEHLSFVRVGTLERAGEIPPSIHIYTSTKQQWISLSDEVPTVPGYYNPKEAWPPEAMKRVAALRAG